MLGMLVIAFGSAVIRSRMAINRKILAIHGAGAAVNFLDLPRGSLSRCWNDNVALQEVRGRAEWQDPQVQHMLSYSPWSYRGQVLSVFIASEVSDTSASCNNLLRHLSSQELGYFPKAVWLIGSCDDDLMQLRRVKRIQLLSIESNVATDAGIIPLLESEAAQELEFVRIIGSEFTSRVATHIHNLKNVKSVEFRLANYALDRTLMHDLQSPVNSSP